MADNEEALKDASAAALAELLKQAEAQSAAESNTDMTGNAFAAIENLHGRLGNAQINELADQTEGYRVPATVGLYVIVRCNTGLLPTGEDVW